MLTTAHGLHYPVAATDPPDGPAQIHQLATDIENILLAGGSSSVATEEARTGGGAGALTTADSVTFTVPSSGLAVVQVLAWADVKQSSAGGQLLLQIDGTDTIATGAPTLTSTYRTYITKEVSSSLAEVSGNFMVGQVLLPALSSGSHTVSFVYWPSGSSTVTAKNRNIRVRVIPF